MVGDAASGVMAPAGRRAGADTGSSPNWLLPAYNGETTSQTAESNRRKSDEEWKDRKHRIGWEAVSAAGARHAGDTCSRGRAGQIRAAGREAGSGSSVRPRRPAVERAHRASSRVADRRRKADRGMRAVT